jgi:hypothetical protein
MNWERQAPRRAGPIGKLAWWATNSSINYSPSYPVCRIPTLSNSRRTGRASRRAACEHARRLFALLQSQGL